MIDAITRRPIRLLRMALAAACAFGACGAALADSELSDTVAAATLSARFCDAPIDVLALSSAILENVAKRQREEFVERAELKADLLIAQAAAARVDRRTFCRTIEGRAGWRMPGPDADKARAWQRAIEDRGGPFAGASDGGGEAPATGHGRASDEAPVTVVPGTGDELPTEPR